MGQTQGADRNGLICLLGGLLLTVGCGSRPRAPALEDTGVYHNPREKVRFLVPEGWVQQMKMDLPPGPVNQERALVIYRHTASGAMLELTLLDMAEDADIKQFLRTKKWVGTVWQSTAEPEPVLLAGGKATRYSLEGTVKGQRMGREVVVFRRGARVYFFNCMFGVADTFRQGQLRQAAESLRWQET